MLEKPALQDEEIIACLRDDYNLLVVQITFLPLGADRNTAVYRVIADDGRPYFLKLRGGVFDQTSVALPKFLSDRGVEQIIAPLATRTGQLWTGLGDLNVILYPFVEGRNGYEVKLARRHWASLGTALKRIHTVALPLALISRIRRETYAPQWRESARTLLRRVEDGVFDDPVAAKLAAFLKAKRDQVCDLVGRAERLARALQAQSPEFVLCHSDVHAGNVLLGMNDALYIVDWDDPILAPKERDLMFFGAGLMGDGYTPREEETLFYRAYGQTRVNPIALAYYRYERIVQDIAVFAGRILAAQEGDQDREQSLKYLASNFLPNNTIEIAYRSDRTLGEGQSGFYPCPRQLFELE